MQGRIVRGLCALLVAVAPLCATTILEAPVWGTSPGSGSYFSDTRTSGALGLSGTDGYASGFSISWTITSQPPVNPGYWNYSYTLTSPDVRGGGISHAIFGLTQSTCSGPDADPGCVMNPFGTPAGLIDTYSATSNGKSNPSMPNPIFGVKFETSGNSSTISFYSSHAPVWGDFYAKGGRDNAVWNTGLGTGDRFNPTNFILRPDGDGGGPPQHAPEPGTWALLGAGLGALAMYRRRRRV